ncbi:uncharacterized protein LOC112085132 [Eutrema salsugineum]|uniref:uncharacterized protein LOC112085132 n=1 Tax=Eutrema salsugineum TaxID=72664 RepID=UPI000CECFE7E|nr:uncharacterized protein LOC112085132 [Eutrema salsugineum]
MGSEGELGLAGAQGTSPTAEEDATMSDIGEKDRPPGDPPDGGSVWIQKVTGSGAGGRLYPQRVMDAEFVEERMRLEFPDGENGEPMITIGAEVLERMHGLWKRCIIVKVLGRHVQIAGLTRKLKELWKPKGSMHVIDLPRQFFMVRFELEEEYLAALSGGPWRVFGSYLMVQAWSPEFDPLTDEIVTTPVWVRLADIPVTFYHEAILMGIGRGLGHPVRVDSNTLLFARGRFARVCVEVDLSKPLKGTVQVNGERYYVAYEGLTNICSKCGVYGHLVHTCPRVVRETATVAATKPVTVISREVPVDKEGFQEVRRRGRKPPTQTEKGASTAAGAQDRSKNILKEISPNIPITNRFGDLGEDMIEDEIREVVNNQEKNKEIVGVENPRGKSASQGTIGEGLPVFSAGPLGDRETGTARRQNGIKPVRPVKTNNRNEKTGPRFSSNKNQKPTRGLVFGPTRGEVELSGLGKRLRVELVEAGRPGGVIGTNGYSENMVAGSSLNTEVVMNQVMVDGELKQMEEEEQIPPPERVESGTAS